ncbi:MAG: hypothetical protein ACLPV4_19240, partial [Solirubrobacteraceae bacterium]
AAVVAYRAFNFLLAATPALIARHQLAPLLAAADKLRRPERSSPNSSARPRPPARWSAVRRRKH